MPAARAGDASRRRVWPAVCATDWCGDYRKPSQTFSGSAQAREIAATLRTWILDRWGRTILPAAPGEITDGTDGWFDEHVVYLRRDRLCDALGGRMIEREGGLLLARGRFLGKAEADGRNYVRYVPDVGRISAYALRRSALHLALPPDFPQASAGLRQPKQA
jgi:hypothetical protein